MITLVIDIISIYLLIICALKNTYGLLLWIFIIQLVGLLYSYSINRLGYFIIWKSAVLNIHRSLRIYTRKIKYKVEEI